MDDQFEKDLNKRISEVFDNYQDNSADEGWQQLREKFPADAKRRPIAWLWWSSAAAVLLILIGILWFRQAPEKQGQLGAAKKPGRAVQQSQSPAIAGTQKPADNAVATQPVQSLAANTNDHSATTVDKPVRAAQTTAITKRLANTTIENKPLADNGALVASNQRNTATENAPSLNNTTASASNTTATAVKPADNTVTNNNVNTIAAVKPDATETQAAKPNIIAPAGNEINQNKPGNQVLAYNSVPKQKSLSGDKRVRFGVYAATFFNYAKGSSNQFNIGAGITSDIRITRKLKLSTGIAIAQNSLSYGGQPLTPVPQGINMAPLALYSANTLQYSMSEPSFKSYNASLVGIDIPVNLKYTFDPGKTETYLLAGLSSGTFINETYAYHFAGGPIQNLPIHNGSGGFYFGKILNLAVGTGYRFGNNRLIIEPFLKYPLDGMGAQQLRFGSGGVNLKFNIPSISK